MSEDTKKPKTVVGYLKVTSFVWIGSIGAEHYYGKIVWYVGNERHDTT